jgi:hypothetical protein
MKAAVVGFLLRSEASMLNTAMSPRANEQSSAVALHGVAKHVDSGSGGPIQPASNKKARELTLLDLLAPDVGAAEKRLKEN